MMKLQVVNLDGKLMFLCKSTREPKHGKSLDVPASGYNEYDFRDSVADYTAMKLACAKIKELCGDKLQTCVELFGGNGFHTRVIYDQLKLKQHTVMDNDRGCVNSIKMNFPNADAFVADSFHTDFPPASYDYVDADFYNFTFHKYLFEENHQRVTPRIFSTSRMCITLTDCAMYGLTKFISKNGPVYAKMFGKPVETYQDYYRLMADVIYDKFGFGCAWLAEWRRTCLMILIRGRQPDFDIVSVRENSPFKILGECEVEDMADFRQRYNQLVATWKGPVRTKV